MWITAIGLLKFVFDNGPAIVGAGKTVAGLIGEVIELITGAKDEGRTDISRDEFNAFVDKSLGDVAALDAAVLRLRAEVAVGA